MGISGESVGQLSEVELEEEAPGLSGRNNPWSEAQLDSRQEGVESACHISRNVDFEPMPILTGTNDVVLLLCIPEMTVSYIVAIQISPPSKSLSIYSIESFYIWCWV